MTTLLGNYSVSVLLNHHQVMRGYISDVKYRWMYKKCKNIKKGKLYDKKRWLFMTRNIRRLINESAFVSLKYVTRH